MKTFEQWLAELVMTGGEGKPQPPAAQKVATVNAKNVAAKALQSTPQIASKIAGGGAGAKQAQRDTWLKNIEIPHYFVLGGPTDLKEPDILWADSKDDC